MIKVIAIIMSAASIAISVLAMCKAAGDYDRQVEEEDGEGSNNKTGRGKA